MNRRRASARIAFPLLAILLVLTPSTEANKKERKALAEISGGPAPTIEYAHRFNDSDPNWDSASFVGQLTIVNFWGTWCPPCLDEMELLEKFYREHEAEGLRLVGVTTFLVVESGDKTPEEELEMIERVLRAQGVTYPNLVVADSSTWEDYHASGVPVTILVDRDGRPAAYGLGTRGTKRVLAKAEALLKNP